MTDEPARVTTFRSADDERRFDELYATLRAERWPAPPHEQDVDTPVGTAHVFSWPGVGLPVLLIPGWGAQATMWAPMLAHGFDGRPVHALDLVGHPGLSVQREPIAELTDYARWLGAVTAELGLDRVHVVGSSYGGLLALVWAAHDQRRIATVSLLDPGGVVDIDLRRFIAWGIGVLTASVSPLPIRRRAAARLHARMILDDEAMAIARLVYRRVDFAIPDGRRQLDDATLRSVTVPTLALLAEHSAIMDPGRAAARARALLRRVTVELIRSAGHGLPYDDAARAAARIRSFLAQHTDAPASG